jgi:hypothetical protein
MREMMPQGTKDSEKEDSPQGAQYVQMKSMLVIRDGKPVLVKGLQDVIDDSNAASARSEAKAIQCRGEKKIGMAIAYFLEALFYSSDAEKKAELRKAVIPLIQEKALFVTMTYIKEVQKYGAVFDIEVLHSKLNTAHIGILTKDFTAVIIIRTIQALEAKDKIALKHSIELLKATDSFVPDYDGVKEALDIRQKKESTIVEDAAAALPLTHTEGEGIDVLGDTASTGYAIV